MRTRFLASISAAVGLATVWLLGAIPISRERDEKEIGLPANRVWAGALPRGSVAKWRTDVLDPAALYTFSASLDTASLRPDDRCEIRLEGPGSLRLGKALHAGDPSYFITFRPRAPGAVVAQWEPSRAHPEGPPVPLRLELRRVESSGAEQVAFEAEPNDSWQEANPLVLGRTVYGGGDDIEYLDNEQEYKIGWDWFRIDFDETEPKLVYFELDLPDRDIPLQLLFYRHNPATGSIEPYARGRDPMEVLHDGQKVRYSKFITWPCWRTTLSICCARHFIPRRLTQIPNRQWKRRCTMLSGSAMRGLRRCRASVPGTGAPSCCMMKRSAAPPAIPLSSRWKAT